MNLRDTRKSFEKFHQFRIFPSILLVEHGQYNYCAVQLKQNFSNLQKVFKKLAKGLARIGQGSH